MTLLAVALAAVSAVPVASAASQAKTITVHGTGIVNSVPTPAEFTFGVTTSGKTARAALAANGAEMTKVIGVLKEPGHRGRRHPDRGDLALAEP